MVHRHEFTLDPVEAVVVSRAAGTDIRRFPLRIGPTTVDPVRFARLARRVSERLEARRLSVSGELSTPVRAAFELLARHRVSVALTGTDVHEGEIGVLVVTDGAQALAITQLGGSDELRFGLMTDEELVDALSGALPCLPAAPSGELRISRRTTGPRSAVAARREAEEEFDREETEAFGSLEVRRVLRARSRATRNRTDEQRLAEILALPRVGSGHFSATGWGRRGGRTSTAPVSWLDTGDGRYLVYTTTVGGAVEARYVPAGPADVAGALRQAIADVD